MPQINLLDAIKVVQDSFEDFTDSQLHKFQKTASEEIKKRKDNKNYNPGVKIPADNAGMKPKKKESHTEEKPVGSSQGESS